MLVVAGDGRYDAVNLGSVGTFAELTGGAINNAAKPMRLTYRNAGYAYVRICNVAYTYEELVRWRDHLIAYWTGGQISP